MRKLLVAFRSFASEPNNETIMIRGTLIRHSVHSLIFLNTSVPHPAQSSINTFTLPFLFPAVGGKFMVVLLLQMFSPAVEKSKHSDVWSESSIFMNWKNPGHLTPRTVFCGTPRHSSLGPIKP